MTPGRIHANSKDEGTALQKRGQTSWVHSNHRPRGLQEYYQMVISGLDH